MKKIILIASFALLLILSAAPLASAAEAGGSTEGHGMFAATFLWIAVLLLAGKFASLVEKIGQPPVLGELLIGVALGNLALIGLTIFEPIKTDSIIAFLAELGVVILLFQIGLESNIREMKKSGARALGVAIIGVVVPFVLGTYIVGPMLLPGLTTSAYLFIGATLTATSVGITARVFKDLGKLKTSAAQVVLGAAVLDDVMGLIILAVVSALATTGAVSAGIISIILGKAILFLIGSVVIGQLTAPFLGKIFSKIHTGAGMKFTLALSFGLIFAFIAQEIGLAPIVGAFAAGLVLDPVHFKFFENPRIVKDLKESVKDAEETVRTKVTKAIDHYSSHHVEDLLEPLAYFLVPIFFVLTGMKVDLSVLFNPSILLVALAITVVAVLGKILAGIAAKKGDRLLVGVGMIPRGEVGLIFVTIGMSLGVVSQEVFSVMVIMIIFSTLLPPPILAYLLKKQS